MTVFNVLLLTTIRRSPGRGLRHTDTRRRSRTISSEDSLTLTLFFATLLSLIGELPVALFNQYTAVIFFGSNTAQMGEIFRIFFVMSNSLMVVEFSGNFIVYCLVGRKFRTVLRRKFGLSVPDPKLKKHPVGQIAICLQSRKPSSDQKPDSAILESYST